MLKPVHQRAQVGRQLSSHLLVLPQRGVPRGSVIKVAILRREVEAINFLVPVLVGFLHHFVERLLGNVEFLSVQHGTTEIDNLCLRVMTAHLLEELLVGLLQQLHVVVVCGKVVRP